jgi:hypothetical protein
MKYAYRTLRACGFSQRSTEGAVQKVLRVSTGAEKCAGAKEPSGVIGSANKQAGGTACI